MIGKNPMSAEKNAFCFYIEELFVLPLIFITKTKTFQIAQGFLKDKTKR